MGEGGENSDRRKVGVRRSAAVPSRVLLAGNLALAKVRLQKEGKVHKVAQGFPCVVVGPVEAGPMNQEKGTCLRCPRVADRVHRPQCAITAHMYWWCRAVIKLTGDLQVFDIDADSTLEYPTGT